MPARGSALLEWDIAAVARRLALTGTGAARNIGAAALGTRTSGWDLFRLIDSCSRVSLSVGVHPLPSKLATASSANDVLHTHSTHTHTVDPLLPSMPQTHAHARRRTWSADLANELSDKTSRENRPGRDSLCPRAVAVVAAMVRELLRAGMLIAIASPPRVELSSTTPGKRRGGGGADVGGDIYSSAAQTPPSKSRMQQLGGPPPPTPMSTPTLRTPPSTPVADEYDCDTDELFRSPDATPAARKRQPPLVDYERSTISELLDATYIWVTGCDTFSIETMQLPFHWPTARTPSGLTPASSAPVPITVGLKEGQDKHSAVAHASRSSAVATSLYLREEVSRRSATWEKDAATETALAVERLGAALPLRAFAVAALPVATRGGSTKRGGLKPHDDAEEDALHVIRKRKSSAYRALYAYSDGDDHGVGEHFAMPERPKCCGELGTMPVDADVRRFMCAALRIVRRRALRQNRSWIGEFQFYFFIYYMTGFSTIILANILIYIDSRHRDLELLHTARSAAFNEAATVTLDEKIAALKVRLKHNMMMLSDAASGYLSALALSDAQTMRAYRRGNGVGDTHSDAAAEAMKMSATEAAAAAEVEFFSGSSSSPFGAADGSSYDHEALAALCGALAQMEKVLSLRRKFTKRTATVDEQRDADVSLSNHRTHNAGHIVPSLSYTVLVHNAEGRGETAVCHEREDL